MSEDHESVTRSTVARSLTVNVGPHQRLTAAYAPTRGRRDKPPSPNPAPCRAR